MKSGLFAGITWALETVILGIALGMSPFVSTEEAIALAPFVATFLHDAFSALYMLVWNLARGEIKNLLSVFKSRSVLFLVLASAIGGPVGMTGYVLAVKYMGASVGAVASAVYPAAGTLLAALFLKERVRPYRWGFLALTLLGVYGLSFSPAVSVGNFGLGILGVLMCSLGWGAEAVVLAKCFKDTTVRSEQALAIRQTVSALIYGAVILPLIRGWKFTAALFSAETGWLLPTIALAALFATVSYLFYYKAIAKIGAARSMALNITYTAWAMFFAAVILHDYSLLGAHSLASAICVVVFGVLAAADFDELRCAHGRKNKEHKENK